ncbi:MAG: hypothetical protein DBY17_08010 [Oscillospiraceae bacterium]|nr:MAG: hypothetical protein DBY17_08010 [Oscillospiraceae bacterium]
MNLPRLEKETIINYNEAEATANIYTHNGALIRKLEALAGQRPEEAKRGRSFPDGGREYVIPKRWVKVNAGPILTEEERERRRERAKATRKAQLARNSG